MLTRSNWRPRPILKHITTRLFSSTNSTILTPRFEGKIALITGGASGLGKATARELVDHGARVVIADINNELGLQASSDLGPSAHFVHCDVGSEPHIASAVDATLARHSRLDIMCNFAGIAGSPFPTSIADLDLADLDRVMRVNVHGLLACVKHAARVMIPAHAGAILCIASISGLMGGMGPHPYTVSKFAVPGIVKSVAAELRGYGVRINCISPSPIPTPLVVEQLSQLFPGAGREEVVAMVKGMVGELKGAICEEVDVARAAAFLVSDHAKYVTGHNLVVDGGFTCFKNLHLPTSTS